MMDVHEALAKFKRSQRWSPELEQQYDQARRDASRLASAILDMTLDPGVIAMAVASVYAALLVVCDEQWSEFEQAGLGLIGDEERLHMLTEQVREQAAEMRAVRHEQQQKGTRRS